MKCTWTKEVAAFFIMIKSVIWECIMQYIPLKFSN